jgi:pimeloyl-ACP methyl ester carboxylesterase
MTQHAVIYVPGLGDKNLGGRRWLLELWRFRNTSVEICSMDWSVNQPWQTKLDKLLNRIDQLHASGRSVSLVGESAGASATVAAFARRPDTINGVVLLCGKSQYPERVAARRYEQNPALREALIESHRSVRELTEIQKRKILNLHPIYDPVVPVKETKIPGVRNAAMLTIGHATSIVFANTLWSWRIVRFLKKAS